jgi:hypothetical protein
MAKNWLGKIFGLNQTAKQQQPVVPRHTPPKAIPQPAKLPLVTIEYELSTAPTMPPVKKPRKPRQSKKTTAEAYAKETPAPTAAPINTAKEIATMKGEPWVNVMGMELDMDNISNGSFELDWNELFVAKLVRAGYTGKTDADIVDQWFRTICQNIVLEIYEQSRTDISSKESY